MKWIGIGLAIAHFLLKDKHRLVVVARSKAPLEELKTQYPEQVQAITGDLGDVSLADKAAALALSTWKRIDGLVVNHGVLDPVKRLSNFEAEEWRRSFDINVFSAVALVCTHMR